MAVLIDLNQVMMSSVLTQIKPKQKIEEDLIKHVIINSLRSHVKKFKEEYGEIILCCDSRNYWRKKVYPHYKAHRKDAREKSSLDWNEIFKVLNQLKQDLKDYFPYKVIEVDGAEADDIIGTLTPRISASEKVIIISSDADFKQLQKYNNVKQYNPMLGIYVKSPDPLKELKEKIIRGDKGDGIPSMLSPDDTFIIGKRQSPISKKKLEEWIKQEPKQFCESEEIYRNYKRNDLLINLENIPQDIKNNIVEQFDTMVSSSKKDLYKYFVKNRMINLLDSLSDF